MSEGKLPAYVFCRTAAAEATWRERARLYTDLEITTIFPVRSGVEQIRSLAARVDRSFLVLQDDVWLGLGFAAQVELLVRELDAQFPNWAACGNRGSRWDGRHIYDFSYHMENSGLQTACCAHPVICLDDGLLLINPGRLRTHARLAPALHRLDAGVLLSLECLQNGSLMAVSPRLMAMRPNRNEADAEDSLETDPAFGTYYRQSFLNRYFQTPDEVLNLDELTDYKHLAQPWVASPQQDTLELFDSSLGCARRATRKPTITICCRTQFRRPELLERAVLSFAVWRQHAGELADVSVQLITDQAPEQGTPVVQRLQQCYPAASLGCWYHTIRPGRFSRTDLLLAAIEQASTDYIWFVDDDDYINAPNALAVARSLVPNAPVLVVGTSQVVLETWQEVVLPGPAVGIVRQLVHSEVSSEYPAGSVFRVFRGTNQTPVCGMILPLQFLRQRVSSARALGDYCEDYFLLLTALTSRQIELCILDTDVAYISKRGTENTVEAKDRSWWHISQATFLLEVLNDSDGKNPLLWELTNFPLW